MGRLRDDLLVNILWIQRMVKRYVFPLFSHINIRNIQSAVFDIDCASVRELQIHHVQCKPCMNDVCIGVRKTNLHKSTQVGRLGNFRSTSQKHFYLFFRTDGIWLVCRTILCALNRSENIQRSFREVVPQKKVRKERKIDKFCNSNCKVHRI